jgi:hypothetical protein
MKLKNDFQLRWQSSTLLHRVCCRRLKQFLPAGISKMSMSLSVLLPEPLAKMACKQDVTCFRWRRWQQPRTLYDKIRFLGYSFTGKNERFVEVVLKKQTDGGRNTKIKPGNRPDDRKIF